MSALRPRQHLNREQAEARRVAVLKVHWRTHWLRVRRRPDVTDMHTIGIATQRAAAENA